MLKNKKGKILVLSVLSGLLLLAISAFLVMGRTRSQTIGGKVEAASISDTDFVKAETKNGNATKTRESVRILFVGDMMFDRYVRETGKKHNDVCWPLAKISDYLNSFDEVVGNNEGTITDKPSVSVGTVPDQREHFMFTFDRGVVDCYKKNNIKTMGIGNNHIMNFGSDGVAQTIRNLRSADIAYFGNPLDEKENYVARTVNGRRVVLISYDYAYGASVDSVLAQIGNVKKNADAVVVFAHWGKEYETRSNAVQQQLAHGFIDAGADVVIGMHPHVVQEEESYKGKNIFYSLGNFVFDQYFDEQTKKGIAVEMDISADSKMSFVSHRVANRNGQVELVDEK